MNHIGDVMLCVLASSVVNCGFESRLGQTKDYTIGICCFFTTHYGERVKSGSLGIRIMYPSGAIRLPEDCYPLSKCIGLAQSRYHNHVIEI